MIRNSRHPLIQFSLKSSKEKIDLKKSSKITSTHSRKPSSMECIRPFSIPPKRDPRRHSGLISLKDPEILQLRNKSRANNILILWS